MLIKTSTALTPATQLSPSAEQQDIIAFVRDDSRNLVVDASPGSGKSTTIGLCAHTLPLGKLYVAMAFNRDAATAFTAKLPSHVISGTWHSVMLNALRSARPRLKVSKDKVKFLVKDAYGDVKWDTLAPLLKLVSLCKQQPEVLAFEDVEDLAFAYGIEIESSGVRQTLEILIASDEQKDVVDFDDMLRFALADDVRFPRYGIVFVDEAQDTNALHRALLAKLAARTVVVGDPYQSIYGFRGADHNAMAELKLLLKAETLPLSVSYRCPQSVVAEAQRVLVDNRFRPHTAARHAEILSTRLEGEETSLDDLAKITSEEYYDEQHHE